MEDNFGKLWQGNGKFKVILDRVIDAMGLMEDNFGKFWRGNGKCKGNPR